MSRREKVAPPAGPIRAHFEALFLETYGLFYLWNSRGVYWPVSESRGAFPIQSVLANVGALRRIEELCEGDVEEACRRIDRAFADPLHRSMGVSLTTVAWFWRDLGTDSASRLALARARAGAA